MARTKASAGAKVASGKSSKARCSVAVPASSSGSSGSSDRAARGGGGGGNPVCPRETPKWQKPITTFFICKEPARGSDSEDEGVVASSSKPQAPKPTVDSDEEQVAEKPINKELDESIELQPLTGEDSHKIEEYYPKGAKGKGVGKKTKGKENIDGNVERRNSAKRELEEITFGEESEHASKRVKVN
ncbi:PCNA-associated factor-like [Leguminivora glycinivorella]|uniref:PCNA-associated factor-like n=1 Tax=Leguminivora glycinivorella TaxID=1035111 RepID=UPI00200FD6C7|nr:PCNA-associated factor-like [Leguminivora glycinivorella]